MSGKTYNYDAEVGLLTRNVVVEGEEYPTQKEDNFGGRVLLGHFSKDGTDFTGNNLSLY